MPRTQWSTTKTLFEYTLINAAAQVLYLGQAEQMVGTSDPQWMIKKFSYITAGDGTTQVSNVQVLGDVAWDSRATLPWS